MPRFQHGILASSSTGGPNTSASRSSGCARPTRRPWFADALHALGELLRDEDHGPTGDPEVLEVVVEGDGRATLFAAWLEELSFLAETEGFMPEGSRIWPSSRGACALG